MLRVTVIALFSIILCMPLSAQSKDNSSLKNIRMRVRDNKILIDYDILNTTPDSLHSIGLSFISSDNEILVPELLSGDIGTGVQGGPGKTIIWDITEEFETLNNGLKPYMYIDGTSNSKIPKGGPEKMFLSLLIPGLGDYFVAHSREMKFKPYMRLASVAGFIALGYGAGNDRWVEYNESIIIKREYEYGVGWIQKEETIKLAGDTHYKYFKHDAEIFYTLGAAIWLADVFWVLNKGYHNNILNTSMKNSSMSLSPTQGGAALTITF